MEDWYTRGENAFLKAYGRYDVVLEKGDRYASWKEHSHNRKFYTDHYLPHGYLSDAYSNWLIQLHALQQFYLQKQIELFVYKSLHQQELLFLNALQYCSFSYVIPFLKWKKL